MSVPRPGIGTWLFPWRFVLFLGVFAAVSLAYWMTFGNPLRHGVVIGFDAAVLVFIASLWPLRKDHTAQQMRIHALANDANRTMVLLLTAVVTLTMLATIGGELADARKGSIFSITLLVLTLALSWIFVNFVYALHYAHMHYRVDGEGGFDFPGTPDPDYGDFVYFAFTAGMSFAASDVNVTRGAVRRVVVAHSLLSFLFNIGVLAFSINVLAGLAG